MGSKSGTSSVHDINTDVTLQAGNDSVRSAEAMVDERVAAGQHTVRQNDGTTPLQACPAGLQPRTGHQYTTCR